MLQNPHYHSHAEQQAALGCAANLDPAKHPRRYAIQQAREKFKPPKHCHQAAIEARTPELLEKARALAHLGIAEVARRLDVSLSVIERLRNDYGLVFCRGKRPCSVGRLMPLAATNGTYSALAAAAGLSYAHTYRLCKQYGITPGVPYGQDAEGS